MLKLSILATCVATVVVVLGAFTRLVDAGLGCPDWPTCYGHLWVPNSEQEIQAANKAFSDTPVETDKTWPEQIHRIFASTLGVIILFIFALAYRESTDRPGRTSVLVLLVSLVVSVVLRIIVGDALDVLLLILIAAYFLNLIRLTINEQRQPNTLRTPFLLPSTIAGLVILQGFFGMWTVTLKLWPQVVTAHLIGGFATLSLLWLLIQRNLGWQWKWKVNTSSAWLRRAKIVASAAFLVVTLQILLGGWTSSNYAALACPDFPKCQNSWWPYADFRQGFNITQEIGPDYLGGRLDSHARTAIHFSHRVGAVIASLAVFVLVYTLWNLGAKGSRRTAVLLVCVLFAQLFLGISNVIFSLPLEVAVAHNAVGMSLLIVIITIMHRLWYRPI